MIIINIVNKSVKVMIFQYKDISIESSKGTDENPWFLASGVAEVLGMPKASISRTLKAKLRSKDFKTITDGQARPSYYINESGLYRLISIAGTEDAEDFQYWIIDEVLPSIRKDGGYVSPEATPEQLDNLTLKIEELRAAIESTPKKEPGSTPGDAVLDGLAAPILNFAVHSGYDPSEVARSVKRRINQICSWELPGLSKHQSIGGTDIRSDNFHLSEAIVL